MERTIERQMCIETCKLLLCDPTNLYPEPFCSYLLENQALNVNNQVYDMIDQYFYENLAEIQCSNYISLMNEMIIRLIPIPLSFAQIFVKYFSISYFQKNRTKINQLISTFKAWVKLASPHFIQQIKDKIETIVRADLKQKSVKPKKLDRANDSPTSQYSHQPRKLVKREKVQSAKQKARKMIKCLHQNTNYCCNQCGRYFLSQKSYQDHKTKQFEQKMNRFKAKKNQNMKSFKLKINKSKLQLTKSQWINSYISEFKIEESKIPYLLSANSQNCVICHQKIQRTLSEGEWIYDGVCRMAYTYGKDQFEETRKFSKNQIQLGHIECLKLLKKSEEDSE